MRLVATCGATVVLMCLSLAGPPALATSVGGCPPAGDWELVSVVDLGLSPDQLSGSASIDGNGDGLTCVRNLPQTPLGYIIIRDNTVPARR